MCALREDSARRRRLGEQSRWACWCGRGGGEKASGKKQFSEMPAVMRVMTFSSTAPLAEGAWDRLESKVFLKKVR